jgi:hypothetical protein
MRLASPWSFLSTLRNTDVRLFFQLMTCKFDFFYALLISLLFILGSSKRAKTRLLLLIRCLPYTLCFQYLQLCGVDVNAIRKSDGV